MKKIITSVILTIISTSVLAESDLLKKQETIVPAIKDINQQIIGLDYKINCNKPENAPEVPVKSEGIENDNEKIKEYNEKINNYNKLAEKFKSDAENYLNCVNDGVERNKKRMSEIKIETEKAIAEANSFIEKHKTK